MILYIISVGRTFRCHTIMILNTMPCIPITLETTPTTQPVIQSSNDDFKTVCLNEEVHLTCIVHNSTLISWRSPTYIPGQNNAIEFARGINSPGDGKLVSLSDGRATLSQLSVIMGQRLEARLLIKVLNNAAMISCFDDMQRSDEISIHLAGIY